MWLELAAQELAARSLPQRCSRFVRLNRTHGLLTHLDAEGWAELSAARDHQKILRLRLRGPAQVAQIAPWESASSGEGVAT